MAAVTDPDDPARIYTFRLGDSAHAACFNIGTGPDGSPIISWSDLVALYRLPDGSAWAEHGLLNDAEDLVIPPLCCLSLVIVQCTAHAN